MDHCLWSQFSEQFKIAMVLKNDEHRAPRIKGTTFSLFNVYLCILKPLEGSTLKHCLSLYIKKCEPKR